MRSFIAGIVFILMLSTGTFAIGNIYIDGIGAFTQTMDAENQIGFGGSILYQVSDDFNVFVKNVTSSRSIIEETSSGKEYKEEYSYMMNLGGVEYLYNINNMPLFWKNSFGIGMGDAGIKSDFDETSGNFRTESDDMGVCVAAWTGILYIFTQNISGFLDIGYHKTFYFDELKEADIMGVQILFGVRITAWGQNKSIYSGY